MSNLRDDEKPPRSTLGSILYDNLTEANAIANHIVIKANRNVALARLRLDLAHVAKDLEDFQTTSDRLPSSIIALFDAGVRAIEEEPDLKERELGLLAILAAARCFDFGISLPDLQEELQATSTLLASVSVGDILRAGKGFLSLIKTEIPSVRVYHTDFERYATEGYNDKLYEHGIRLASAVNTG
jgi:hypothetical protein